MIVKQVIELTQQEVEVAIQEYLKANGYPKVGKVMIVDTGEAAVDAANVEHNYTASVEVEK